MKILFRYFVLKVGLDTTKCIQYPNKLPFFEAYKMIRIAFIKIPICIED